VYHGSKNRNFILKMKKPKNFGFEPVSYPKNVLLASVVHGISCFFIYFTFKGTNTTEFANIHFPIKNAL
jgi:hypothetical protein